VKINKKSLNISIIAIVLYFTVTLVRYFKDAIFKSNTYIAIVILVTLGIFIIQMIKTNHGKIPFKQLDYAWLLILLLMIINRNWEYEWLRTLMCIVGVLSYFFIGNNIYYIKYGMVICVFFAVLTAVISWFSIFDYNGYLAFLQNLYTPTVINSIASFYRQGMMSGLTTHYSSNTFYMISAIIILLSDSWAYRVGQKKDKKYINWIIILFLLITSLMVGKRGHLIFLMATIFISFLFMTINNSKKLKQIFLSIFAIILGLPFIIQKIPQTANFFTRLFGDNGGDILNGRGDLYSLAIKMFISNPILGRGYGSFSVLMNLQNPGVHNDYLQFLCEWGLVGFVVCMIAYGGSLYSAYRLYKCLSNEVYSVDERRLVIWSFMFQLFVTFYSLTGIPHYDFEVFMLYCLACAVPQNIIRYKKRQAII